MNTDNMIDFTKYDDSELELLIQGLGSIRLDFEGELESIFSLIRAQSFTKEMLKSEIDKLVEEEVEKAKIRVEEKSDRIAILKAKLISLKRARSFASPSVPKSPKSPVAGL